MALTQHTLQELRSELVVLQQERSAIDARIKGIDLILSSRRGEVASTQDDQRRRQQREASLRSRVTEILQVTPGLKAAHVAEQLQHQGFKWEERPVSVSECLMNSRVFGAARL